MQKTDQKRLYKIAFGLSIFTILYNLVEGLIATYLGYEDENLTLFGFGADSFIEMISGFGIAHMIFRIQRNPNSNRDDFERTALRITGYAFYTLVIGLLMTSIYNIWIGHQPKTTFWGIVISLISIAVMWALMYSKTKVGRLLNSQAMLADVECTRICIYMSVVLLVASGIYELVHLPYIDSAGTLALAYLSFKEGKECFEKANNDTYCSGEH
jgi:peptidoglycan/LPS O-acetylase OafA/YrhL